MSPSALVEALPAATDTQVATITSRFSVNGVPARRSTAPKISGALAPSASSDMFKGPQKGKPTSKNWDHLLSEESKSRLGSTLKESAKYLATPGLISLGGGLPTSEYFPFESIDFKVPVSPNFTEAQTQETGQTLHIGKHDYANDKSLYDIHIAFNYGQATGSAQLLRFITEHTEIVHNPPYADWNCAMTAGSTNALDMALRMFCNRGECILSEEYTFVSAVETAVPMGVKVFGVGMDEQGLRADALDEMLSNWDATARGHKKPHVLYTVPTGGNPTGTTQSFQRRRDIYAVAQKHDLYIFEDDPYYFLQMSEYHSDPNRTPPAQPESHDEFIASLIPSYLSMDIDGRVMRMDSFSKVLSPGSRVGWITASAQIIDRFVKHANVSTQNPSGMSQLVLYKLLEEGWGHSGYLDWLVHLRKEYSARRDVLMRACDEFLPKEICHWTPPVAGMFHWIGIDWRKHPDVGPVELDAQERKQLVLKLENYIFLHGIEENGVLVAKGSWFRAEQDGGENLFFRTTFAAASGEQIHEAIRRLGMTIRKEFKLDSQ